MLCCGKVLFLMLCSAGREIGDGARAAHKAGLLALHLLLNSLQDLQIFKTACMSFQMLMKTWAITSKGILEILSADSTLNCPSWQMELLTEIFWQRTPFFGQTEEPEQSWGLYKHRGRMEASVPSTSLVWFFFLKGGGLCTEQGTQSLWWTCWQNLIYGACCCSWAQLLHSAGVAGFPQQIFKQVAVITS